MRAVQLLLERGRALGFDPDRTCFEHGHRQRTLVELARRLDGNPLALEHAAARLGLMAPCQLLERLDQRFEILTSRTDPSASLRDAIARSWLLLSGPERSVFAQLSVFGGPFELAAAESVVTMDPSTPTLDVLDALVRKSLVHVVAAPWVKGHVLNLYESLRSFGREQLVADRALLVTTVERHAERALARAALLAAAFVADRPRVRACLGLRVAGSPSSQASWPTCSRRSSGRSTPKCFLSSPSSAPSPCCIALQPMLRARGQMERAGPLFESALSHAHLIPVSLATRARTALAEALYLHGRGGEAAHLLEQGLASVREDSDRISEAMLVGSLGASHFVRPRRRHHRGPEMRVSRRSSRWPPTSRRWTQRMRLARAHENEGHIEEAINRYQQDLVASPRFRSAPKSRARRAQSRRAARPDGRRGRRPLSRTCSAWSRELGDPLLEAVTLANLGIAAFERADDEDARAFFLEAARVESRLGFGRVQAIAQGHLALLSHLAGDHEHVERYRASLAAWGRFDPLTWSLLTLGLALLATSAGDVAEAQRMLGRMELVHGRRRPRSRVAHARGARREQPRQT